jgi:hypothetical protein
MAPNIHLAIRDQTQLMLPEAVPAPHHTDGYEHDGTVEQESSLTLDHLPQLLSSGKWDASIALIHLYHDDIAQHVFKVVCQGETYAVTPMHFAVGTIMNCPILVLQSLFDAHPAALLQSEAKRGLSPVHLGLIKSTIGVLQMNYLFSVCPEIALHADKDGNLPLHLAVEYASDEMIQCILAACPAAAGCQTKRQRYALHLFASSHCQIDNPISHMSSDTSTFTIATLKALIDAYPYALQQQDLQGRLPLHLAACTPYPRWDVVQFLCDAYPEALLIQDENHKIPLQLLKRFSSSSSLGTVDSQMSNPDNDIILTFLHDRTIAEKRKKNTFHKMLRKVVSFKKRAHATSSSDPVSTIDWMNCYG